MYRMDADGVVFHDPSQNDETRLAMGTEATLEVNKAGSLTFTLPPGNVVYKALRKRKSVVTLYQGSEIIFRGRVLDTVMDLQNLCEVYCEGELALLIDSLQPPIEYKGTAAGYFRQMVANHNATMDADKQFVVGEVSAVTSEHVVDVETDEYRETLEEMRSLLVDEFGGYLRVRYSGGVRYLDYIKEYNSSSNQKIQFGVNLVDVERRNDTINLCTVLIPIGKKNLTIAKVNGGSVYLEDAAGIAQYGRIEKVKKFERIEDETELLEYGLKAMEQLKAERSITIKAVDMKIVDDGADSLLLGDKVYLDSEAHELSETELCTKAVIKLDMPDQSEYTFGTPLDKLTDNLSSLKKKADSDYDKLKEWLTVTDEELQLAKQYIEENGEAINNVMIRLDAINSTIELKADRTELTDLSTRVSSAEVKIDGLEAEIKLIATESSITELKTQLSQAMIRLDGAEAAIELKADRHTVDDLGERLTQAEIDIDGANAAINLKASKQELDSLGERLSQAEINIDGANAAIELKASKEEVDGVSSRLSSAEIKIDGLEAEIKLIATQASIDELTKRLSQAEIDIDGAEAQISLKASQSTVDALGERVTSAELLIDGQNSKIEAKADLILLDGYVKADELETEVLSILEYAWANDLDVQSLVAGSVNTNSLSADSISTDSLTVGGVEFDPSDYATKSWVEEQGYLKSANLSNYATRSWVIEQNYTTASDVAQTLDGYVMQGELDGYATEAWVRENFSKASAAYKPTVIERYGTISGNSIPVRTLNASGTVLLTGTVDAGDVYDNGHDDASITNVFPQTTYIAASNLYRINLQLVAKDGTRTPFSTGFYATEAYEAGQAAGGGSYGEGYEAGQNSVTLTEVGWSGRQNIINASNGKTLTISLPQIDIINTSVGSDNKQTIYATTDGYIVATKELDHTFVYERGFNAGYEAGQEAGDENGSYSDGYASGQASVTLSAAGWQGSSNVVSASNGKSVTVTLPIFSASGGTSFDSNHQTTVYFSTPSVTGYLSSKTVDASSVYNAGYEAGQAAGGGSGESSGSYNDGYNAGYADAKVKDLTIGTTSYYASSKTYTFPVTAIAEDGTTTQETFGLIATEAYDAGYAAGQEAGSSGDYDDGYSDGYANGQSSITLSAAGWVGGVNVVSASNGKSLNVSLPSFSVSGGDSFSSNKTTVYFYTGSVNGPLASKEVDATNVYDSGYSAGNKAGFNSGYNSGYTAGQASIDTGAYYDEGYEIGYAAGYKAAKEAVKVTAGISWSNPAQYYAMVKYWGRATIDGVEVGYASSSESKNISGYV